MSLTGKKILIGISGSIAAYKIPLLVRLLVKEGAEVRLVMTDAAKDFVSELTLSTLSKAPVLSKLFAEGAWSNHVMLGRWADLFLVAPLSCNTASKMAAGACDNLLLATYLSATCPVAVAPAMDEDMWKHPATRTNLERLRAQGVQVLPVGHGELASGLIGEGRMAEPGELLAWIGRFLAARNDLKGKKALVTAGPTYEALDPVRFIGNHSSGKMGYALAGELARRGAEVHLVSGPVSLPAEPGVHLVQAHSARLMYEACMAHADYDIAVMAAAVADYTPVDVSPQKIKKTEGELTLTLRKTDDILAALGARKKDGQLLVGFALETENEAEHARQKLARKGADLLVLNSLRDAGAGFAVDTNKVTLFYRDGHSRDLPLRPKTEVARDIVDAITELI
ncbi:MAG: bifunctional phosphopantothenoylcysteine decarboxylase/phosphopantothenate--cysteine ligase CoaBC [Chitinophagaceae bacterium]|nr:MAG: bifunctional phosphopantothenoylcysteine decarboxylase/phosphopantothenate--cysteine ligase CoaBC [Chitinophagaceae bacterium]